MSQISRRLFLAGLGAGLGSSAFAEAPLTSLRPVLRPNSARPVADAVTAQTLIEEARLGQAAITFAVADVQTGEFLVQHNASRALPPASVAKVPTSLYALDRLGADFRFSTRLIAAGEVSGGRLNGDLILAGGGDPTVDTDDLGDMARGLRDAGIHEVTGAFLTYADALPTIRQIDDSQPPHVGYNPSVSGLNLNYNRVYFEWAPTADGYQVSMDARAERFRPQVRTSRMSIVDRDLPVYTYSSGSGRENWTVARTALGDGGGRWLPVRRPDIYTAEVFQSLARSYGIVLRDPQAIPALPRGTVLVDHQSDTLREILRGMLRYSTNITAEALGLRASVAGGTRPGSLRASGRQMQNWAQDTLGIAETRFVDHSGLGGASRLSAHDLVKGLIKPGTQAQLWPILKEISLDNSPLTLRAKTGTLNFVSSLAGYVRNPAGRNLAFAVIAADVPRRNALPESERERPEGGRAWSRRARNLQFQLVQSWGAEFS